MKGEVETDLLQVAHHLLLAAAEDAAEEFDDLLVVEVVDALDDSRQEQLHRQVEVTAKLIWVRGTTSGHLSTFSLLHHGTFYSQHFTKRQTRF